MTDDLTAGLGPYVVSDKDRMRLHMLRLKHGNINERVVYLALQHGAVEGAHHKQWVIDQTLRLLAGAAYSETISEWETLTGLEWDTGVAP